MPKRLRDMDRRRHRCLGIVSTTSFAMSKIFERDYAVAYARAYNDFIVGSLPEFRD